MQDCTFKPETNKGSPKRKNSPSMTGEEKVDPYYQKLYKEYLDKQRPQSPSAKEENKGKSKSPLRHQLLMNAK